MAMVGLIPKLSFSGCTWAAARSRSATLTQSFISPWRCRISSRCRSARIQSSSSLSSSAAVASSGPVPWLMLPPSSDCDGMLNNFYDLQNNKVVSVRGEEVAGGGTRVVGSSHGWLVFFKELGSESEFFLWNPLTHTRINLPFTLEERGIEYPLKVILSCSPDDHRCRAIMTYNSDLRLAVCTPGVSTAWSPIGDQTKEARLYYHDIAFSAIHNRLFCLTHWTTLERWDIGGDSNKMEWELQTKCKCTCNHDEDDDSESSESSDSESSESELDSDDNDPLDPEMLYLRYLVFSEHNGGEVLAVVREIECSSDDEYYSNKTVGFDVFKLDGEYLVHKEETLDGLAIFIGINNSFAVNAAEFGLKPDSIYFTTPVEHFYFGHDHGIFSYQNRTISPCYFAPHVQKVRPPPLWFIH